MRYALVIPGQTPAQKNNKNVGVNPHTGRQFVTSNKTVKDWQKDSLRYCNLTYGHIKLERNKKYKATYFFYVKDNRQRDLDNMIVSVNDLLQVVNCDYAPNKKGKMKPVKGTGLIQGDHWQVLKIGEVDAEIDAKDPRAVIYLEDVPVGR